MNKSAKKILLFLAFLVAAIIIISVIYLLAMKPSGSNGETPSPSAPVSASVSPSSGQSPSPSLSPSPTDEGSVTTEVTANGTIYHITVPGSFVRYSVTVDEKAFSFTRENGNDLFKSKINNSVFLNITFKEGAKAIDIAPSFLDPFLKYTQFEQSGENDIPGTKLSGETVTAGDGTTQLEAWLVDTDKGVLAVLVSHSLTSKDAALAQLFDMLATLTIE